MISPARILLTLGLVLLPLFAQPASAQDALSPRLQIGTSILPAVIAADKRLASAGEQKPPIYLVYLNNRHLAERLGVNLQQADAIQKRELQVTTLSLEELLERNPARASAVFVAEPMGDELDQLIQFSHRQKVLLFSPHKGDVERGVATGFRVTDKVRPMVNMSSLKQSNIFLKAFFLRIAVKHE